MGPMVSVGLFKKISAVITIFRIMVGGKIVHAHVILVYITASPKKAHHEMEPQAEEECSET